jgi:hypothetical protein
MQQYSQHGSKNPRAFNLESMSRTQERPFLQAAFERLELSHFLTLEQAMLDPEYAIGIRNLAEALKRWGSAEKIAYALVNRQLDCRLEFTRAFRAELRAVIAAPELSADHAA